MPSSLEESRGFFGAQSRDAEPLRARRAGISDLQLLQHGHRAGFGSVALRFF